jgi:1-acyl-sn-glycerol-3-phosphate acyltransferase
MARDSRADIIPIVLDGTAHALPKKGAILTGYSKIRVRVLDPIPYQDISGQTNGETLEMVHRLMSDEYDHLHHGESQ